MASPNSDAISTIGHNLRVSTGGTSKMETIKAFVQANQTIQNNDYRDELKSEMELRQCTIQNAELQAHPAGFKQPLYQALNGSRTNEVNFYGTGQTTQANSLQSINISIPNKGMSQTPNSAMQGK